MTPLDAFKLASMGPCFRGMENVGNIDWTSCENGASMGPCFRGMENQFVYVNGPTTFTLQWGHALGAWKTIHAEDEIQARKLSFNGAML